MAADGGCSDLGFPKMRGPQNGWFVTENHGKSKMDELYRCTTILGNLQIVVTHYKQVEIFEPVPHKNP